MQPKKLVDCRGGREGEREGGVSAGREKGGGDNKTKLPLLFFSYFGFN